MWSSLRAIKTKFDYKKQDYEIENNKTYFDSIFLLKDLQYIKITNNTNITSTFSIGITNNINEGNSTIVLDVLEDGLYSACSLRVIDQAGN